MANLFGGLVPPIPNRARNLSADAIFQPPGGFRRSFATGINSAAGYLQTKAEKAAVVTKEAATRAQVAAIDVVTSAQEHIESTKEAATSAAVAAKVAAVNAATSAHDRIEITAKATKLLEEGGQEVEDRLIAKMAALEATAAHQELHDALLAAATKFGEAQALCSKFAGDDTESPSLSELADGYAKVLKAVQDMSTSTMGDLREPVISPVEADAIRMLSAKLGARWAAEQTREGMTTIAEKTHTLEGLSKAAEKTQERMSKTATLVEWGAQKIPELVEMDMSDLIMTKAIADINRKKSSIEHIFVSHKQLKAIHLINRDTASQKCDERAASVRAALPLLESSGMKLSESLIEAEPELKVFQSVTGFQVAELLPEGVYVTFEGNGRREALKRAFSEMPDVDIQVEVRLYKFEDEATAKRISDQMRTCREWKNVDD